MQQCMSCMSSTRDYPLLLYVEAASLDRDPWRDDHDSTRQCSSSLSGEMDTIGKKSDLKMLRTRQPHEAKDAPTANHVEMKPALLAAASVRSAIPWAS